MALLMRAVGFRMSSSAMIKKEQTLLEEFESLWNDFDSFFQAIVKDDKKVIKELKKKSPKLINAP